MDPIPENPTTPVIPPVQPAIPPKKPFPFLLFFAIVILLAFSGSIAYLFAQNIALKQQLTKLQTSPTPIPTPAIVADPTTDWKTYTNEDYGFSFSYPKELTYLYDHLKGGNILLQNFDGSSPRKELDSDFQMVVTADDTNTKPLEDYPKQWETELGKLPTETISVGGITAIKGFSGQKFQAVPTVWFSKSATTFMIQLSRPKSTNKIWFDQILSTFKFL